MLDIMLRLLAGWSYLDLGLLLIVGYTYVYEIIYHIIQSWIYNNDVLKVDFYENMTDIKTIPRTQLWTF